ncbi:MAG: HlyD family secretion protein [Dysgonamonadaceae bacterium]|jgi:membrane fusion protein (multidrug efflux system)|nr:HlyD family secretion protein [Dysgonamonadaceae bacterium]
MIKIKIKKTFLFNIFIIAMIIAGFIWVCSRFVHLGRVEFTDNAQVRQQITPVNSRVQGFIREIRFGEYQFLHKGDTLLIVEDAEFRLHLAQAEANYQSALAGKTAMETTVSTTRNNLSVSDAAIEEVRVLLQNAEKDYLRYEKLLEEESVTRQQFDGAKTSYETLKAKHELLVRQKHSTALVREEQSLRLDQHEAAITLAAAAIDLAKLNLSYTVILAPCDGITSRKTIQEGQFVQVGQTLLSLVDESDKWVIANYKETQTAHIGEGMDVDMQIDAIPGIRYKGRVQAISKATGAQYSIIPQDNAAGNFVKVEQRIPVKIVFTEENNREAMQKLRAGLNVACKVNYRSHASE